MATAATATPRTVSSITGATGVEPVLGSARGNCVSVSTANSPMAAN